MHDANPMLYFGILTKITNQIFQILDPNQPDQRTRQPPAWLSDVATPKAKMEYNWIKTC